MRSLLVSKYAALVFFSNKRLSGARGRAVESKSSVPTLLEQHRCIVDKEAEVVSYYEIWILVLGRGE